MNRLRQLGAAAVLVVMGTLAGCAAHGKGAKAGRAFDVRTYGAKGDGVAKDTGAFQQALDACAKGGGGEVRVPAGKYVIGSVVMGSGTTLRFDEGAVIVESSDKADFPIVQVRWEGRWREGHRGLIYAKDAKEIAIVGPGRIEGNFEMGNLRNPRGPAIVEPVGCTDVRLEGFSVKSTRIWTVHLADCSNVVARGLTIRTDRAKSNGDGIDVDSTKHVIIEKCDIDGGDDAIALKSGRGMEAVRLAKPTEDVVIRDSKLASSFAAVAFGTEMSGGLRNIRVEHCTFGKSTNGIYIKSRIGRGGVMEDITVKNVVNAGPRAFCRIELTNKGIQDSEPVEGDAGIPAVKNVVFDGVKMEGGVVLEAYRIDPKRPVVGLKVKNVSGRAERGITLANVRDVELSGIDVTVEQGAKVRAAGDVTGKGLEGAERFVPATQATREVERNP